MSRRYSRLGQSGQVRHPHIRGNLSPFKRRAMGFGDTVFDSDASSAPIDANYFVPSFSIRRHLHSSEELVWNRNQRLAQRALGRGHTMTPAANIAIKTIEQRQLVRNMRAAEIHPDPNEIRDIAYAICDGLTELLTNARSPMPVPLGKLERFGRDRRALAYEIGGWRGYRAHYSYDDQEGYMTTNATLAAERQLAIGTIATAYADTDLKIDDLALNPHLTIARSNETIQEYQLRSMRSELAHLAVDEVLIGDPVIEIRTHRHEPTETLYVGHARNSLALMA